MLFPAELLDFVNEQEWVFAKTMPKWPHEYLVRERVVYVQLVQHIRAEGYEGNFYRKEITYYDEDGMTYWTMGAPVEETIIINRCKKEDTYEVRLAEGRMPQQRPRS